MDGEVFDERNVDRQLGDGSRSKANDQDMSTPATAAQGEGKSVPADGVEYHVHPCID